MNGWSRPEQSLRPLAANNNLTSRSAAEGRATLGNALRLRREVEAFESNWPNTDTAAAPVPTFSWAQLERQLVDLTDSPVKAAMAKDLVSATRKMATFKPPEMVLREILCLTWALLDEDFQPELEPEKGTVVMP